MRSALLSSIEPGMHTRAIGIGVLGHSIQGIPCTLEHLLRGCHVGIDLTKKGQHTSIRVDRAILFG